MATKYEQLWCPFVARLARLAARNPDSNERFLLKNVQASSPNREMARKQLTEE